ncbi:ras modification protein ERF4 [Monosporozyma servazzii]
MLQDSISEEICQSEPMVETTSTRQETNQLSNVIIHLPPIINQPVQFISGTTRSPDVGTHSDDNDKEQDTDDEDEDESHNPLFFNYHEFQETYYLEVGSLETGPKEHDKDHALVITHFPNVYVPPGSLEWSNTRIVRIPRAYGKRVNYPYFSEFLPGSEPAAIANAVTADSFVCQGKIPRDGQWYGFSSVSPLSLYLTATQFQKIISQINQLVEEDYQIGSSSNIVDSFLGFLTFGIYSWIKNRFTTEPTKVDKYITQLNNSVEFKQVGVTIIPLARSGYLSLDFQVPVPIPSSR